MNSISDLVISLVYLLYVKYFVVQRVSCLMVSMDISMMVISRPFDKIFKLSGLMYSIKEFVFNFLSLYL